MEQYITMVKLSTILLMDMATASQLYAERREKLKGHHIIAIQHYHQPPLSSTSPQQQVSTSSHN